jgi:hypothetical protein
LASWPLKAAKTGLWLVQADEQDGDHAALFGRNRLRRSLLF